MRPLFRRRPAPAPPVPTAAPVPADARETPAERAVDVPAAPGEGAVLGRRYRLGPVIGQGGMATVHAAHDLLLAREVAVKVFRTRAESAEALRQQEAEARLIASLNHYGLTTLFDAGVDAPERGPAQIYLVMERVASDLRTRLRQGPLSVVEAAWLGFDLSEALDYVHQAGFLHRDVKPANVLLSDLRSAKPIVGKLADFGIASLIGQREMNEFTVGSAAYLSPEQVEGLDATPESDVYSLGLVLLEAITGHVEYPGGVEASAFARLERDPRIPVALPTKVAEVLRGMTTLEPGKRIRLEDAALRLQQYLVDVLVAARDEAVAALPSDEVARVAALQRLDVLDTGPDPAFDAITRLASRLLGTPIALLTLVDADRVWFKSVQGWDEREVAKDVAFCSTTGPGTGAPWTVPDALADSRTAQSPLVLNGPRVRSYAGAPLVTADGHELGALCVLDREPREFTDEQLASLADLAGLALHEMEMRRATRRALFDR